MALQIPGFQVMEQRARGKLIARQDILKFENFNLELIQAAGVPQGQHEVGSLFFNGADRKLYLATDYKILNTPSLAWYKFNDNAQDFISRNNGTVTSSTYSTGKYGTAINFDGTDDKVVIPAAMNLSWSTDWTMSFWIKMPTAMDDNEELNILERYKDADEYCYLVARGSGTPATIINFYLVFNNTGGEAEEVVAQVTGAWQDTFIFVMIAHDTSANETHFAVKVGAAENANDNATVSIPAIAFTTEDFEMGRNQAKGNFGDEAYLIDDFKIWNEFRNPEGVSNRLTTSATIDLLNIDKVHWASGQLTVAEAT